MEIIINKGKRIENPTLADVEIALLPMTNHNNFEVLIQRSENDWLRAIWKSTIGIKLEYENPLTAQIFEDVELFISQKRTILIFQAFAKNYDGWENQVKWVNQGDYCLKSVLQKTMRPIQTILLVILIATLAVFALLFRGPEKTKILNNYLNTKPFVFGILLIIVGIGGITFSYVNFMYRHEIEDDIDATPAYFIYSTVILIFGLIVFMSGFLG